MAENEKAKDESLAQLVALEKEGGTDLIRAVDLRKLRYVAEILAKSDLVPEGFRGKPENVLLAMLHAKGLGLDPFRSLQNMFVVKSRVAVFGDLVVALVRASRDCEGHEEWFERNANGKAERCDPTDELLREKDPDKGFAAICWITRGGITFKARFSVGDAVRAKLWYKRGKSGDDSAWVTYPQDMLMWKARTRAIRLSYADRLGGVDIYEDVMDLEPERIAKAKDVTPGRASLRDLAAPLMAEPEAAEQNEDIAPVADNAPPETLTHAMFRAAGAGDPGQEG